MELTSIYVDSLIKNTLFMIVVYIATFGFAWVAFPQKHHHLKFFALIAAILFLIFSGIGFYNVIQLSKLGL